MLLGFFLLNPFRDAASGRWGAFPVGWVQKHVFCEHTQQNCMNGAFWGQKTTSRQYFAYKISMRRLF